VAVNLVLPHDLKQCSHRAPRDERHAERDDYTTPACVASGRMSHQGLGMQRATDAIDAKFVATGRPRDASAWA
jgi:hypothetical protein